MVLPVGEFLRRFLLHLLPKGYRRVRMFGFLSNRYKKGNLERIRALLQVAPAEEKRKEKASVAEVVLKAFGVNILRCPQCGRAGKLADCPAEETGERMKGRPSISLKGRRIGAGYSRGLPAAGWPWHGRRGR